MGEVVQLFGDRTKTPDNVPALTTRQSELNAVIKLEYDLGVELKKVLGEFYNYSPQQKYATVERLVDMTLNSIKMYRQEKEKSVE